MRFAAAFSTNSQLEAALHEACGAALDELDARVDVAFVLFSAEYIANANSEGFSIQQMARHLVDRLGTDHVFGCCGESIVANQYELEWQPALALWVASLPGASIEGCHLEFETMGDDAGFAGWTDAMSGHWPSGATMFGMSDPYSFPMDVFLHRMNEDRPGVEVFGGIASGAHQPGEARLIMGSRIYQTGAVMARISGDFHIRGVVSQGCRPIGSPLVITKAERNEIYELGGQPALQQLQAIFATLPTRDKQLVNRGLHVGRVISEYIDQPKQGDFLIRNVVQIDEETGVVAIADFIRPGQTIQFQVRDQETAHAEFKQLLSEAVGEQRGGSHAALMFSCNGRGTRLFNVEHHDAGLLREVAGPIPVAGFFAAGEMGPVGGKNFLHGFTTSVALFQDRRR
ncbi:MAG: FIST signal transduction protein [Pirellulaceae bacterium]